MERIPVPEPGKRAPHQDLGLLIDVALSSAQDIGERIMDVLDKPFDVSIKIKGPHRLLDNLLDTANETVRTLVKKMTY